MTKNKKKTDIAKLINILFFMFLNLNSFHTKRSNTPNNMGMVIYREIDAINKNNFSVALNSVIISLREPRVRSNRTVKRKTWNMADIFVIQEIIFLLFFSI